uniref:DekiORF20 n=1 Tax=Dendrolimus kikuchii nucleopolyhedrovirus TaxID=1219875 RepID=V9LST6_9ABAC|nr:DekiORF20 [Dendrolimus kikuchii nucleopolyhedrovirus]
MSLEENAFVQRDIERQNLIAQSKELNIKNIDVTYPDADVIREFNAIINKVNVITQSISVNVNYDISFFVLALFSPQYNIQYAVYGSNVQIYCKNIDPNLMTNNSHASKFKVQLNTTIYNVSSVTYAQNATKKRIEHELTLIVQLNTPPMENNTIIIYYNALKIENVNWTVPLDVAFNITKVITTPNYRINIIPTIST